MTKSKIKVFTTILISLLMFSPFQNCSNTHVGDLKPKSKTDFLDLYKTNPPELEITSGDNGEVYISSGVTLDDDLEGMTFLWLSSEYEDGPYQTINYSLPFLDLAVLGNNFGGYIKMSITIETEDLVYSFITSPLRVNIEPKQNPDTPDTTTNLVAHFDFESQDTEVVDSESVGVVRSTDNLMFGILTDEASLTSNGAIGKGLLLDGDTAEGDNHNDDSATDGLDLRDEITFNNWSAVTISAFINLNRMNMDMARIVAKTTGTSTDKFFVGLTLQKYEDLSEISHAKLKFRVRTNNYTTKFTGGISKIDENDGADKFVHVAGVYDGQHMILYQDGKEVGRVEKTGLIDAGDASTIIGYGQGGPKPFDGVIDEVRIYDRALTEIEIKELATLP